MTRWILLGLAAVAAAQTADDGALKQLLAIHRVYVDRLTGGETAAQMRDIIITSLEETRLFVVTENQEKADTIMRGAAEDLVYSEVHSSSDGVNTHSNVSSGNRVSNSHGFGIGFGENDSDHSVERRHEAIASVRLVNKDGDVIWATTQESLGAKFHGASADVADKIANQLKDAYAKARAVK